MRLDSASGSGKVSIAGAAVELVVKSPHGGQVLERWYC